MITVTLQRNRPSGKAVQGRMTIPFDEDHTLVIPTLENADFLIPAGIYPLTKTYSPKFRKMLPFIEEVPDRQGIRCADTTLVHEPKYILAVSSRVCSASPKNVKFSGPPDFGTRPEHSTGCILVNPLDMPNINLFIDKTTFADHDELQIQILDI